MPRFVVSYQELEKDPIIIEYTDNKGKERKLKAANFSMKSVMKYKELVMDFKNENQTLEQAKLLFGLASKEDIEWLENQDYRQLHEAVNIAWNAMNTDETVKKNLELLKSLK